jgi:hypothetical protein
VAGTTLSYLPDGQQILYPSDAGFYGPENRVAAWRMTHDFGQVGAWLAQRPLFQGLQTSSATVGTGTTGTFLDLQVEMIDNYDMHAVVIATNHLVIPPETGNTNVYGVDDLYLVIGYVPMSSASTAAAFAAAIFNVQTGVTRQGMKVPSATGHAIDCLVVDICSITANPFDPSPNAVGLVALQNTGANVSTTVSSKCPSLTVGWIGGVRAFVDDNTGIPDPWPTLEDDDQLTANATGASPAGGVKVPMNAHDFWPISWMQSPPMVRLTSQPSTQSFTNLTGVFTPVQLPTASLQLWDMWTSGANTLITAVADGLHYVYGLAAVNETTAKVGYRAVQIVQTFAAGGTAIFGGCSSAAGTGTTTEGTALPVTDLIQMSVGDTLELQFAHTNGSTLTVRNGAGTSCLFIAIWMCL